MITATKAAAREPGSGGGRVTEALIARAEQEVATLDATVAESLDLQNMDLQGDDGTAAGRAWRRRLGRRREPDS